MSQIAAQVSTENGSNLRIFPRKQAHQDLYDYLQKRGVKHTVRAHPDARFVRRSAALSSLIPQVGSEWHNDGIFVGALVEIEVC